MLICPKCDSKRINQFRTPTGRIWCENCGFQVLHKEVENPFIRKQYNIRVAADTEEGEQFVLWLLQQGHNTCMSEDTGNYINNTLTSINKVAHQLMTDLWNDYCEDAP